MSASQLLLPDEFAQRAVGMPYRRPASGWDGCDCAGLVFLYHREVLGLDPGPLPDTELSHGFAQSVGWAESEPLPGFTAFVAWQVDEPVHCGMLMPGGMLLHAQQFALGVNDGSVRANRLAAMARMYQSIRFYRFAPKGKQP